MDRNMERIAVFGALDCTFEALSHIMDHWGQCGWAAINKSLYGDELYYLDGQPVNDDQRRLPRVTTIDTTIVTATTLGRLAALHHVASYTLGQLGAGILLTRVLGYRIPLRVLATGHILINGVTHFVIDRRRPLHTLATNTRPSQEEYLKHVTVVRTPGGDADDTGPGTALFELDKSLHRFIGWAATLVTTWIATRQRRK